MLVLCIEIVPVYLKLLRLWSWAVPRAKNPWTV